MQKEHRDFPCCGRSGGGGGRANLEGTSALFPPLSAPSSEKGWYSLLRWGRNVPCVSYGLCPVLHWLLYIYTSFFSRGILLPVTPALICLPPTWAPAPTMGQTLGSILFWEVRVGGGMSPGGEKLDSGRSKPPVPFSLSHQPARNSLQGHGHSKLGLKILWASEAPCHPVFPSTSAVIPEPS